MKLTLNDNDIKALTPTQQIIIRTFRPDTPHQIDFINVDEKTNIFICQRDGIAVKAEGDIKNFLFGCIPYLTIGDFLELAKNQNFYKQATDQTIWSALEPLDQLLVIFKQNIP